MRLAIAFLFLCLSASLAAEAGRTLTVEFPSDYREKTFRTRTSISFSVVLHALNVEDRNQFESLVIDDWRYDTPNYFIDRRSPNVVFHVERFDKIHSRFEAVGFRTSSQGGGGDLEKASVDVDLYVGGESPSGGNEPGRYRITATYTGLLNKQGRVLLTTGPVEVTVQ